MPTYGPGTPAPGPYRTQERRAAPPRVAPPGPGRGPESARGAVPPPSAATLANWSILSLGISLIGLMGLAGLVYGVRLHGLGASLLGFPTRDLFVLLMALVAAPLFLAWFHRVPAVLLLIPIATLVLLYPFFNPFDLPYSRDPVYNFQFANVLLQTGHWVPGAHVTQQAVAYSYYPGSAVYGAEFAVLTGLPLTTTFLVSTPLLHLLILPAAIFAMGSQLLGPRGAYGGLLIYLGTPSILFNVPVEQEFALPFFTLTLLGLCLLSSDPPSPWAQGLRIGVVLFSSYVVLSHHLSSYFLAAWLAGLFLVPYLLGGARERQLVRLGELHGREVVLLTERTGPVEGPLRAGITLGRYMLVFVLYSLFVSAPVLYHHLQILEQAFGSLVQGLAPSSRTAALGQSFPVYQQVWIYLAIAILLLACLLAAREFLRNRRRQFLLTNLVVAGVATLATIPFLPTTLGFLPLREMEYSAPIAAPALGWWLYARLRPRLEVLVRRLRLPGPRAFRRLGPTFGVFALGALVLSGGLLVPIDVRDQFAAPSGILVDSPLHVDPSAYTLAQWARTHLNDSHRIWGDYLVYSVFGGFGEFLMRYDQYTLFNGTNISNAAWHALALGDYIVTDRYMTVQTPEFPGPSTAQPNGPLSPAAVAKFNDPPYIATIYQDASFTIYEVLHKPPGL